MSTKVWKGISKPEWQESAGYVLLLAAATETALLTSLYLSSIIE